MEPPAHRWLSLDSGRSIQLLSLSQRDVYAEVIEGVPHRFVNDRIVEGQRVEAERRDGRPPWVVPPPQRPIGSPRRAPGRWEPLSLPPIACTARFFSHATPRHDDPDWRSVLTIVWFQDDYAFPIDDEVARQIRAVDWDRFATDRAFA